MSTGYCHSSEVNLRAARSVRTAPRSGFTLLELLVVVAILAVVAGSVILAVNGSEQRAAEQVASAEILEIKQAILQFQQDTGWLPKTGPFDLESRGGQVRLPAGKTGTWFDSPANLAQLYEQPLGDTDGNGTIEPILPWNADTGRGWRGPYLSRRGPDWVTIGSGLTADGSGNPESGFLLTQIPAAGDRHSASPSPDRSTGPYFRWSSRSGQSYSRWGRPYLLIGLRWLDPRLIQDQACVLSFGPNGVYESTFDSLQQQTHIGGDDQVLYLFR